MIDPSVADHKVLCIVTPPTCFGSLSESLKQSNPIPAPLALLKSSLSSTCTRDPSLCVHTVELMVTEKSNPPRSVFGYFRALLAMFTSNPLTTFSLILPLFTSLVFLPSLPLAAAEKSKMTVLPLPTHSTTGNTVLCLANDFQTSIDGFSAPDDLTSAMGRTEKALWSSRHRFLSVERGEEFFHGSNTTNDVSGCKHHLSSLVLSLNIPRGESTKKVPSILDSTVRPVEDRIELEAYHLSVPVNGPAHIEAKTALGLFRGLTTFEQLFYHLPLKTAASGSGQVLSRTDSLPQSEQLPLGSGPGSARETTGEARGPAQSTKETGRTYAPFAPYEVDDKPAFGWRAVLRDTSRNYFSVASLIKVRRFRNIR